jgi:hypothetical protein
MAYFIFLKYLSSLEEFRKNPHVKIPPKSPCANFQSLGIFKNLIFIQKGIFFGFRPSPACAGPLRPAGRRLPARPKPRWRSCRKAYSLRPRALRQRCLLSLTSLPCGAHLSAPSPSHAGRLLPFLLVASGYPTPPSSTLRCRPSHYSPRHHFPPLIPPLNLAPIFDGVKAINDAVTPPSHPSLVLPLPL